MNLYSEDHEGFIP